MAVIRDGEAAAVTTAGRRNATTGATVTAGTIFEAASLSKPVFAYAVLQLVNAGALQLDVPLAKTIPDYVPDDPQAAHVTARDVLRHTTGLPNWRSNDASFQTHFPPGTRFSYSGEGFVWLQRVVEAGAGEPIAALMQRLVFDPLGMRDSGYTWRPEFDRDHADPHDAAVSPATKSRLTIANTAHSLQTTAVDYGRFLTAVLSGARLAPATARLWLEPHVHVQWHRHQCLSPGTLASDQGVAWGLGWGLEPESKTFFHWGDNGRFKAFVIGSVADRSAVVIFTNGENGMSIMPHIVDQYLPGHHPVFKWLDYAYLPKRDESSSS